LCTLLAVPALLHSLICSAIVAIKRDRRQCKEDGMEKHLRFYPNIPKLLSGFVLALLLGWAGVYSLQHARGIGDEIIGWVIIVLFSLGTIIQLRMAFSLSQPMLEITNDGILLRTLLQSHFVPWQDIASISIVRSHVRVSVTFSIFIVSLKPSDKKPTAYSLPVSALFEQNTVAQNVDLLNQIAQSFQKQIADHHIKVYRNLGEQ
jgi:hypothetical protein